MWDARGVIVDRDAALARALVDEACRKSALLWLRPAGADRAQAAWHVYVDGAVHVVSQGLEQAAPELADGAEVDVTVRSKDTGGRVVTFRGTVSTIAPADAAWDTVVAELHAKRLNPPGRRGAARALGPGVPGRPDRAGRTARRGPGAPVAPLARRRAGRLPRDDPRAAAVRGRSPGPPPVERSVTPRTDAWQRRSVPLRR